MSVLKHLKNMQEDLGLDYYEKLRSYLHKYGEMFEGKKTLEFYRFNHFFTIQEFNREIKIWDISKKAVNNMKVSIATIYPNITAKVNVDIYNDNEELIERMSSFNILVVKDVQELINSILDEHFYCDMVTIGKKRVL
ncbi:MAG: hypothetical protein KZY55_15545 [Paeniclostridium sp.]|uniref:hypothetical protein n=1 Tax=Clostridium perfringens TaxID=1502 RepID=UPI001DB0A7C4|nr:MULTISPECIES: hypothetical protein [Clostridia]MBW4863489.1 hypothetical protein [Paeniclostridium sp.]MBW4875471.1 hypothetical protein [Paeniclostridium sp.]